MTPEVTEGPYFVMNELVRQNVHENQWGVPLPLDIGVIDITSCKPLPNAFVEIWHANATGFYSSFTVDSGSGGGNSASTAMSDELSFVRGGWPANKNGMRCIPYILASTWVELSIFTTIESTEGNLHIGQVFFDESFNDKVLAPIPYVIPLSLTPPMYNADDSILAEENTGRYNTFADAYQLGKNLQDRVIAYITIGIDSTTRYSFSTANYWMP
ncbi:Intradiol ring-cleavage dioxygenase [Cantharellus anzutake]|uniref:Intradiol ring-cleavage dioxygenase n=1 Tax=Cantharellus anzutake TaxID=1750568 RepID=UPI0019078D13|nr:Intradiol ring-cleavage dioxygenase [Cantharellus anzutake]KAF8326798.1 Intradiol ring-cleavage dioxygenase [Cantharellus anzutake]